MVTLTSNRYWLGQRDSWEEEKVTIWTVYGPLYGSVSELPLLLQVILEANLVKTAAEAMRTEELLIIA